MQTALHIYSLLKALRAEIIGAEIIDTQFYRKQRRAIFYFKAGKDKSALALSFHPAGYGLYLVPPGKIKVETGEKPFPVPGYESARVAKIEQLGLDRIIKISLDGSPKREMLIEAIGPNANVWLLDKDQKLTHSLRKRQANFGEPFPFKATPDGLNPFEITGDELVEMSGESESWSDYTLLNSLEKKVLGFNRTLAREAIHRARLNPDQELSQKSLTDLVDSVHDLAERFNQSEPGYLYQLHRGVEVYPFKLASRDEAPERFKTLSLATMELTQRRQARIVEDDDQKRQSNIVTRAIKKLKRRLPKIETDIASAADYEKYRRQGELLQINLPSIKKGSSEIVVEDVYSDPPVQVRIKLMEALSPSANVERYFKKARKGEEGLALLRRRLEISAGELANLEMILSELEIDFDSARQRYEAELSSMTSGMTRRNGEPAERLPYREHVLSTGLKIFIGRQGADNDRTTFEFTRPYELWFHTQQCPGSHVVIKAPNKSFEPTQAEIEETAAIAAWHSKARNNKLVPVIYTQRKYVRKPRKAKPGLVTVEREKSVMVEPREPKNDES